MHAAFMGLATWSPGNFSLPMGGFEARPQPGTAKFQGRWPMRNAEPGKVTNPLIVFAARPLSATGVLTVKVLA